MMTLDGIRKAYGARTVLAGVSLSLAPGRIVALVGPNGSGKTTLIKLLLGLARPDAGRLVLDGVPCDADGAYRARIGYAPQAPRYPEHLAVGEVFAMLRALRPGAPVDEALVDDFGLRGEWATPVGTLSGGWRQKVAIACAFLFAPDLLILDEPTAGLDPIASGLLKSHLRASGAGSASSTRAVPSHSARRTSGAMAAESAARARDSRVASSLTPRSIRRGMSPRGARSLRPVPRCRRR